jgi:hypothetical protein
LPPSPIFMATAATNHFTELSKGGYIKGISKLTRFFSLERTAFSASESVLGKHTLSGKRAWTSQNFIWFERHGPR